MKRWTLTAVNAAMLIITSVLLIITVLHPEPPEAPQEPPQEQTGVGGYEITVEPPQAQETPFIFPLATDDFMVTSEFGIRVSPILQAVRRHTGVDLASVRHAQVVAIADGTVLEHWPAPDGYYKGHTVYGGYLVIDHGDGIISAYAHLSQTYVHQGYRVRQGQVIARTGNTGASRGDHLHFEMIIDGQYVNPLLYMPAEIQEAVKAEMQSEARWP
jgi:murein DD-endopeptidase MepM/ murein hydrolase activator NlpD